MPISKELEKRAKKIAKEHNKTLDEYRKEHNIKVDDLIAMSQGTDPFWMTKAKVLKAFWAEKLMDVVIKPHLKRLGTKNIHLRSIHYILTGEETSFIDAGKEYITWEGKRYVNSDKCWDDLITAFSVARYLGFIDYNLIRDKKNQINIRTIYNEDDLFDDSVNKVNNNIDRESMLNDIFIKPFRYMLNVWNYQPVHIELWVEKDLALIEKVANNYRINYIIGEGETSVTMVYKLLDRIKESKKPVRIGYISDCDVIGTNMVKAMSRKLEYILWKLGLEIDVKIIHLMLTPTQVRELNLPTTPMKLSKSKGYETRKKNWIEARDMTGAVEVNTLEAQHPEFFKNTLEEFIESYLDIDTWNKVIDYNKELPEKIRNLIDADFDLKPFTDIMESIDWDNLSCEHEEKIDSLKEIDFKYKPNDDDYEWLFDSERNYGKQLEFYQKFKDGEI